MKIVTGQYSRQVARKVASGLAVIGFAMGSGGVFADQVIYSSGTSEKAGTTGVSGSSKKGPSLIKAVKNEKGGWDLGRGWEVTSSGGLSYVHPDSADYWFKLSGVIRLDETFFMGSKKSKQSNFPSGGNLRLVETYMDGGIGENWEYTLGLTFLGSSVSFTDTWLSYSGFLDNNQVFVGRVSGNWFGLDNSNSTSWNPFLERSLPSLAFYPGDGLGVMTDFWWDIGAVTLSASQPDQASTDLILGVRDKWKGTIRGTIAPVHETGDVWHFGVSGAWREIDSTYKGADASLASTSPTYPVGAKFETRPSARARNTAMLLSTLAANAGNPIRANNVRMFNVEMARQYGPFMLEGEYTSVFVHRVEDRLNLGDLRFDGWNVQTRYLLTGESHQYDVRDGNFGAVKPNSSYGALEVAARYDFLDLNDKDIRGGSQHDVTLGLNWFINQQVRLSANYLHQIIRPANYGSVKRNLDTIGLRCQVRFK